MHAVVRVQVRENNVVTGGLHKDRSTRTVASEFIIFVLYVLVPFNFHTFMHSNMHIKPPI